MEKDITETVVKVKLRNLHSIFTSVVVAVVLIVTGWFDLRAEAKGAKTGVSMVAKRVARLECLVEQQNNYQIYKIKPSVPCTKNDDDQS